MKKNKYLFNGSEVLDLDEEIKQEVNKKISRPIEKYVTFEVEDWQTQVSSTGTTYFATKQIENGEFNGNITFTAEVDLTDESAYIEDMKCGIEIFNMKNGEIKATAIKKPSMPLTYRFLYDIEEVEYQGTVFDKINEVESKITKVHVNTLNGTFFHEKTNSGFVQINKIEGKSVQNGTPTPDNPIEIKSFSGEVVTSGKNLIDMEYIMNYFNGKRIGSNNISKESDGSYKITLDIGEWDIPITLDKNKRYAMSCQFKNPASVGASYFDFYFTDGSHKRLTGNNTQNFVYKEIIVPEGKVIDRFVIGNGNGKLYPSWYKDFQLEALEDGQEEPSSYEPFHATKTEKLTLRSLPNGVKDTLERQGDGSYLLTQKVDFIELNGTENWTIRDYPFSNKMYVDEEGSHFERFKGSINSGAYCNRYPNKENIVDTGEIGFFIGGGVGYYTFHVVTSEQTLEEFKNKLITWKNAGKPLVYYGELKNHITRKLWLSPLSACEGQTNIFANSEVGAEMEVEVLTTNAVNEVIQSNNEYIFQERPNPNLLVNSDFTNLINTTGKKEFVFKNIKENKIFSGWRLSGGLPNLSKVIIQDGGILLDSGTTENGVQISQDLSIRDSLEISEKKVTLSKRYTNFGNSSCICDIQVHKNGNYLYSVGKALYVESLTYQLPKLKDGEYFSISVSSSASNAIRKSLVKWIKLELGDKATPLPYEDSKVKQLETDGVPLLYGGTEIKANDDLNNFVNVGNYYCTSDATATTLKNTPSGFNKAFTMEVKVANGIVVNGSGYCYYMQKIEDLDGRVFKRSIGLINGNYDFQPWTKTDSSVVGSEVPKMRFLTQPMNLGQDSNKSNITLNVNGGKGLFFIHSNNIQLIGLNGRTGSLFCSYSPTSLASDVTVRAALENDYNLKYFLFVDGVNKPIYFRSDALNVMGYFDVILPNLTSLTFKSTSSSSVKVTKIAEII